MRIVRATKEEKDAKKEEGKKFSFRDALAGVGGGLDAAVAATGPKMTSIGHKVTEKTATVTGAVNNKVQAVKDGQTK